ncbi:MAG: SRPBCC family protein [Acidobacteriota bacterium]
MPIELRESFACDAEDLWNVVGDVARTDWVPDVETCAMEDDVRRMTMRGAGKVAERILECDAEKRYLRYTVIESAAPLTHHLASIEVRSSGDGSLLLWRTEAEPEAVLGFIRASMDRCVARLREIVEST